MKLAAAARSVVRPHAGRATVTCDDPGVMIASLLLGDLSAADVWIREVLGGLAAELLGDLHRLAQAGEELAQIEWFRQIIVRP